MVEKYYAPIIIDGESGEETLAGYGKTWKDVTRRLIGNRWYTVILIEVNNEEVAHCLTNEILREQKADSRKHRCCIQGKSGKLIVCPEANKCGACKWYLNGDPVGHNQVSVEALVDSGSEESYAALATTFEDKLLSGLAAAEFVRYIHTLDKQLGAILDLLLDEKSKTAIARELGIPRTTLNERIKKIQKLAQKMLS